MSVWQRLVPAGQMYLKLDGSGIVFGLEETSLGLDAIKTDAVAHGSGKGPGNVRPPVRVTRFRFVFGVIGDAAIAILRTVDIVIFQFLWELCAISTSTDARHDFAFRLQTSLLEIWSLAANT